MEGRDGVGRVREGRGSGGEEEGSKRGDRQVGRRRGERQVGVEGERQVGGRRGERQVGVEEGGERPLSEFPDGLDIGLQRRLKDISKV